MTVHVFISLIRHRHTGFPLRIFLALRSCWQMFMSRMYLLSALLFLSVNLHRVNVAVQSQNLLLLFTPASFHGPIRQAFDAPVPFFTFMLLTLYTNTKKRIIPDYIHQLSLTRSPNYVTCDIIFIKIYIAHDGMCPSGLKMWRD